MKFITLDIPPAGTWIRDCEVSAFNRYPHLSLEFSKESNETRWRMVFNDFIAYKVTSHEFMVHLISLDEMPDQGAFYILEESPWLRDLEKVNKPEILIFCKHYVFFFYDEVVEIISNEFNYSKL